MPQKKPRKEIVARTATPPMAPLILILQVTLGDLRLIHEGIADMKNTMVSKTDVKEIITSIVSELKK